ncbi:PAS domain S-box-containing protein [Desulfacinum hydrothermale DSM 13146]|uniref:histidine kinase n=1 Tax=Desulfacinum hydrothermale DSM 13146 TaxID=1121390 RepID=A0A1W1XFY3_9BACT|nr:ATP-binding protein [Desulfacinum hydrothermale]SMC22411.1 PAS domain S-box-containing protein [Desulfacinum hydrothermale DSM 13146]
MQLPFWPVLLVDLVGSALMIVFSILCVGLSLKLRNQDRENVVWTYLLMVSHALTAFAVSRGVGHIAKELLILGGRSDIWAVLRPYSGSVNTITFCVVGAVTLFFERIWGVYQQVLRDKEALQKAHAELLFLNRHLEDLVQERTQELARSEGKYRRIFEVSRDMIAVVAADGTILDINPAGCEMLGIPHGVKQRVPDPADLGSFFANRRDWDRLRERILRECYVSDAETRLVAADGREVHVLLSAASECEVTRKTEIFHFVVKDISQRKVMQQQLLQADKLASIGQLAAGIAHEINNPLGIILGYTQLLIREEPEGTERLEDLRTIERHTRTCKTIVEDLLSFSRRAHTKKERASLHETIEEVLSVVRHNLELDQIRLEKDFDRSVPTMVLDRDKMRQVFMNLIMNAKQAIGKDGLIRVVTRWDSQRGQVRVIVSDNGCGMDPKVVPRIFDPFFTTKSTGEGTGLGLSVSYGIVKNHGGDILVESRLGEGSTFTVVLPVESEDRDTEKP